MKIKLTKKPKSPTIIGGFPGIGLIGTIATEFLVKHLDAKPVGHIWSEKLMPVAAIHDAKIIQPLEIYYDKKHNILILHALSDIRGMEWKLGDALIALGKAVKAKEIICLEGVLSRTETSNAYYLTTDKKREQQFNKIKTRVSIGPLTEGIIMGVTAALLLRSKTTPMTGVFVETHSKLPDSKAAAKIIEVLDGYLGLKVDYKPLVKAAEEFEGKLRELMEHAKATERHRKDRSPHLEYMG